MSDPANEDRKAKAFRSSYIILAHPSSVRNFNEKMPRDTFEHIIIDEAHSGFEDNPDKPKEYVLNLISCHSSHPYDSRL